MQLPYKTFKFCHCHKGIFTTISEMIYMVCKRVVLVMVLLFAFGNMVLANSLEKNHLYGEPLVTYAQVDRPDGTYRRMLIPIETLENVKEDQALPNGTRILMETYGSTGNIGTVFISEKVDGQWLFGSFLGGGKVDFTTRAQASCLSCHINAADTDFVFTRPSLNSALELGTTYFSCDRRGRSPCELSHYLNSIQP